MNTISPKGALAVSPASAELSQAFDAEQRFLWGLGYRMTGSAADADDIVQETFVRALERPPRDITAAWRPWLTRVALNLSRDLLRRRRRRSYVGPWLPSPIETGDEASPAVEPTTADGQTTEGRYDLLESISMAFLLALEALSPQQRAMLLLRDVFDYSVREVAEVLDLSEANVKTTHHRARQAMAAYDRQRCRPTRARQQQVREALQQLFASVTSGDAAAIEAALSPEVVALSDGAGEFYAARVPVVGPVQVAKFYRNIYQRRGEASRFRICMINGLPGIVGEFSDQRHLEPPRVVNAFELDEQGRVLRLYSVLATAKLTAIRFV